MAFEVEDPENRALNRANASRVERMSQKE
jgi:hypothetical protein